MDNPREAWIVTENAHEALIDEELFQRVQSKIHDRRRSKVGVAYRTHTTGNGDLYLLSGLVYCGHCGCKMHGANLVAKGHHYPKYVCSTYCRSGKHNVSGCGCHAILQDRLVDVLVRKIQTTVLTATNLERLRTALHKRLDQQRSTSSNGLEAVRKQLSDLNREIERGVENFLRAPAEVLEMVGEKLTALKRQRDHLQKELQAGESAKQPKTKDVEAEIDAVVSRLWRLGEDMAKADPARRREVFRLLVSRIELRFDKVQRGKRTECPFRSGEIHLRTEGEGVFGSVNRGDRI
jgi:site-specific DNA recombinase